jgi:hypothetical protein
MDRVLASMSSDDTVAALRLLYAPEECHQMTADEAETWWRRIAGWARFNLLDPKAPPSA